MPPRVPRVPAGGWGVWGGALGSVVAGVLVADFLTAAVHWFEDTYLPFDESPGLLGQIARANDMHHYIPYSITAGSWWENCEVSVLLLGVVALVLLALAPRWAAANRAFLLACAATMGVTNLVHRFQHERDCRRPAAISALMRSGLLVSREQHRVHHQDADVKYGVLLGFTNDIYDGLGVWRALEAALALVGVRRPARKKGVDAYAALHDDWLRRNMSRDCPAKLTKRRLARYNERLAHAHRSGLL